MGTRRQPICHKKSNEHKNNGHKKENTCHVFCSCDSFYLAGVSMKRTFVCEADKLSDTFWGEWKALEAPKCMICGKDMVEKLESPTEKKGVDNKTEDKQ